MNTMRHLKRDSSSSRTIGWTLALACFAAHTIQVAGQTVTPTPSGTAAKPVAAATKPVAAATKPVAAATKPVAAATKPVAAATKPVAAATKPVAAATKPVAAATKPVAAATKPVAAATRPVAAATRPVAAATRPVAAATKPVAAATKPVAAKPETARQKADRLKKESEQAEAQALKEENEAAEKLLTAATLAADKAKIRSDAAAKRLDDLKAKAEALKAGPKDGGAGAGGAGAGGAGAGGAGAGGAGADGAGADETKDNELVQRLKDMPSTDVAVAVANVDNKAKESVASSGNDNLVVPAEFIRAKLGLGADLNSPLTVDSVAKVDQLSFQHSKQILDMMLQVANRFTPQTDVDLIIKDWSASKQTFLDSIDITKDPISAAAAKKSKFKTNREFTAWVTFFEAWENQVFKTDKSRFRDALLQAGPAIHAFMLGLDNAHIEAMLKGGAVTPANGGGNSGSPSSSGGGNGRITHLTIHHTRIMNRIIERHARHMARY